MKYVLIAYFLGNIFAKNCCNRMVYVKITASQRWDVFETQCRMEAGMDVSKKNCTQRRKATIAKR